MQNAGVSIFIAAYRIFRGSLWALVFLTRDHTWASCIGSIESKPLDHQVSPL